MTYRLLAPVLILLLTAPALASPGGVARELRAGTLDPARAAEAWRKDGTTPDAALKLLARRAAKAPRERSVTLKDRAGRETDLRIEVPSKSLPGRDADGRYGLLLVLHGLGGNSDQLIEFGRKIAPPGFIVAAPSAQKLEAALENEDAVVPEIAARALPHWWSYKPDGFPIRSLNHLLADYPIDTDRVVIMGYSMGGFGTWNVGLRYPDRFAALIPLAGGISRAETFIARDGRSRVLLENARMVPSFFVHGDADQTVPFRYSRTIAEDLAKLEARHTFHSVPGGRHLLHAFLRGNELTRELSAWLGEQRRDPHPKRVEHTLLASYHGSSYWVRVDAASAATARVTAEVTSRNRIDVVTEGVRELTVFLDPALVAAEGEVTVVVDGAVRFQGEVEPSLKAVAESFAERRDPALTYTRAVRLDLSTPAAAATAPAAEPAPAEKPWY